VRDPAHPTWPPTLDRLAVVHRDPAMVALGMELTSRYPTDWSAEAGTPAVLRTGEPMFVPVITDAMVVAGARDDEHLALLRALRFSAVIVVPLVARGLTLGLLTLCMSDSGRCYDAADLALAQDLAQRAATSVDNARLYRDARAARADAEAANRAKSQFLSTMSHELRTPLNAITGYTELLEMGVRGPVTDLQRVDLARVRRSANVLMALVNDVLNFARLEAGQVEVRLDGVPLARVLADLEVLVAPQVTAKRLACTFEACDESLTVRADPDRLTQILTNLLTNAIKFTPEGGSIGVGCRIANDPTLVHITVTDDGRGVAPDQLERIFEPFVQVDRHLNPESQQGVGLGLAISRDLARAMGGELTAASTQGAGSSFIVTLPQA
jgi:signal transduction histidine kinase